MRSLLFLAHGAEEQQLTRIPVIVRVIELLIDLSGTLELVYSDDHIIVVDKAHGEHSQPPAGPGPDASILTACQRQFDKGVRLVHRLDRDASGLLVLARSRRIAGVLGEALRTHSVERVYRARVAVLLPLDAKGTIRLPLKWAGGRAWVDDSGVEAVTHWKVESHASGTSELEIQLETGRMHQVRVHLAARLAPIVGDRKYGGPRADRLYLRAVRLSFMHPATECVTRFSVTGFT